MTCIGDRDAQLLELELYHDDELPPARRAEVSAALRRDPALRSELLGIQQTDALARASLLETPCVALLERSRVWRLLVPAAAAVLLAALHPLGTPEADQNLTDTPAGRRSTAAYEPIRVLMVGVAQRPQADVGADAANRSADTIAPRSAGAGDDGVRSVAGLSLDEAVSAGQIEQIALLALAASADERAETYRRIGARLSATTTLRRVLDQLPPEEQVRACGVWARQSQWEAVVCPRLRELGRDPAVQPCVANMLATLGSDPGVSRMLRAHRLLES